jgi:hypothetical protein
MKFLLSLTLQVLPLNAFIASCANTAVQLVVMALAIWRIVNNVERGCLERFGTSGADKTLLMVPSGQAPISRGNGFAFNSFAAAFAIPFRGRWLDFGRGAARFALLELPGPLEIPGTTKKDRGS